MMDIITEFALIQETFRLKDGLGFEEEDMLNPMALQAYSLTKMYKRAYKDFHLKADRFATEIASPAVGAMAVQAGTVLSRLKRLPVSVEEAAINAYEKVVEAHDALIQSPDDEYETMKNLGAYLLARQDFDILVNPVDPTASLAQEFASGVQAASSVDPKSKGADAYRKEYIDAFSKMVAARREMIGAGLLWMRSRKASANIV